MIEFSLYQYLLISEDTRIFKNCVLLPYRSLLVVHFWAPWAPQCVQMNDVMAELAKEHPQVSFVKVLHFHLQCRVFYEFISTSVGTEWCGIPPVYNWCWALLFLQWILHKNLKMVLHF